MAKNGKKHSSKKPRHRDDGDDDDPIEERFRAAETRPQFRPVKQQTSKVVLDERFASVLTDPRFQLEGKDKYGRRKESTAKDELSAFYTVEDDGGKKSKKGKETDDDDNGNETDSSSDSKSEASGKEKRRGESNDDSVSGSDDEDAEDPASRIAYLTAFSRGELDVSSSSDEDDDSESSDEEDGDDDGEDPVHGAAGVLDPSSRNEEVEITYDASPYLVVTNLDWDHMRAVDVFCFLSSFTPPGAVKSVKVYQSDFGKEQMEKEKVHGPTGLWKKHKSQKDEEDTDEHDGDNEFGGQHSEESSDDDSNSENEEELDPEKEILAKIQRENMAADSDFDPEKLRAYEASRLKYYFGIVEFSSSENADIAYREVDGLEFEHSSAAVDLRAMPEEAFASVVEGRLLRDEAGSIPSNYEPPEFVVSALQQTNVQCTWDAGDPDRERVLSKYSQAGWEKIAEADDLKAYIASDASSDEEESDEEGAGKGSKMRKLLGLDSDSEDDGSGAVGKAGNSSDDESDSGGDMSREVRYMPGQRDLEDKIRSKLSAKDDAATELTPWEKYQEKRKQKRKERRQAARGGSKRDDDSPQPSEDEESDESEDDFFEPDPESSKQKTGKKKSKKRQESEKYDDVMDDRAKKNSAREELELLMAGEDEEEQARDYDIRGIQRMEKNKGKKLKGSRKRKEEKLAESVSGTEFKVNVEDNRFAAVLDGSDDRFGIDKTDPNYKDTQAMRDILAQQSKRRKKKRKKSSDNSPSANAVVKDVSADATQHGERSSGSAALSSLVKRLKSKVSSTN